MAEILHCPICSNGMAAVKSWLCRCDDCGFLQSNLRPGAGTGIEGLEDLRRANFEQLLDQMGQFDLPAGRTLLEVGCAKGWFLEAATARGFTVFGLEPEAANADIAKTKGFDVLEGFFPQNLRPEQKFDCIVFNDVFEHLPDPAKAIRGVEAALNSGGLAVINLPSSEGAIYRLASLLDRAAIHGPFDRLWQRYLSSPHIGYFSPDNLDQLVSIHTTLVSIGRMRLDAVTRKGLRERVTSTNPNISANLEFAAAWSLSWFLAALPSDIVVSFYRKSNAPVLHARAI